VGPGTQFWPVLRIDLRCSYETSVIPEVVGGGGGDPRGRGLVSQHLTGPLSCKAHSSNRATEPPPQKTPTPGYGTYRGAMIYWIYLAAGEQGSKFKLQASNPTTESAALTTYMCHWISRFVLVHGK
jgi:hypothetical protein